MSGDNVVPMPDRLERLAKRIKDECALQAKNRAEWIESSMRMWPAVAEAREQHASNQAFGAWWDGQDFRRHDGKPFNHQDRAAMIEMGGDPTRLRDVLSNSHRISARLIHEHEWRLTSTGKTPSGPSKPHPKIDEALAGAEVIAARGETPTPIKVMRETGVSDTPAKVAVAMFAASQTTRAEVDEEAVAKAAEAALPKSTKEKLAIAMRHELKRLEAGFEERVRAEAQRRLDHLSMPYYNEKLKYYEAVVAGRDGVFTKAEYNKILACLHPDHVATLGQDWVARHNDAFRLFREAEIKLLDEKESPQTEDAPWTLDELERRKAAVKAERAAKRAERKKGA